MSIDPYGSGAETFMRAANRSSCVSMSLTFWSSFNYSDTAEKLSIEGVSGTKSSTGHRNRQATVSESIKKGPFRVTVKQYNETGGSLYLTGSARCYTSNGKA